MIIFGPELRTKWLEKRVSRAGEELRPEFGPPSGPAGRRPLHDPSVDALDPDAVDAHSGRRRPRRRPHRHQPERDEPAWDLQGTALRELDVEDFTLPPLTGLRSNVCTGTSAARWMTEAGSGVLVTMSASASGLAGRDRTFHATGGFGVACAAIEEFTRTLAAEVGPYGVRAVCLRPDALPETWPRPGG
jgi:3-oxoacyl-[acyl-carrier protein] reductase